MMYNIPSLPQNFYSAFLPEAHLSIATPEMAFKLGFLFPILVLRRQVPAFLQVKYLHPGVSAQRAWHAFGPPSKLSTGFSKLSPLNSM